MSLAQFWNIHAQVPASRDEKQLVARYVKKHGPLCREIAANRVPVGPLLWWHFLHNAEREAGIRRHTFIRPI